MVSLQAQGIYKAYDSGPAATAVLKGVDLEVPAGAITYIIGPSGCGKSTLLNICGLIDTPDRGAILIDGRAIDYGNADTVRLNRIGYVFQHHSLIKEFTVLENVLMPCWLSAAADERAQAEAKLYLEKVGLVDSIDKYPSELSGGERQRVAICRAMVKKPELLLLDEPTGDLDTALKREIEELLYRLVALDRMTVIMVTHEVDRIPGGGNVYEMDGGMLRRVVNVGRPGGSPVRTVSVRP